MPEPNGLASDEARAGAEVENPRGRRRAGENGQIARRDRERTPEERQAEREERLRRRDARAQPREPGEAPREDESWSWRSQLPDTVPAPADAEDDWGWGVSSRTPERERAPERAGFSDDDWGWGFDEPRRPPPAPGTAGPEATSGRAVPAGRRRPAPPIAGRLPSASGRVPPQVYAYRRRRAVAVAALAGLLIVVFLVFAGGGGGQELSPREQLRAERAENPVQLTVAASGDLLIHSPLWNQALANGGGTTYDFAPMLAPVKPYIEGADLALCHVETPLGEDEPSTFPLFRAPAELADAVAATGWDACDTASNHSLDQHLKGIGETADALDAAGVPHTGSFATPSERDQPLILEAKGVKIGFVAYTDYTNGIPLPEPWAVNVAEDESEADEVIADAKRAWQAGAEAVIVNMHWGEENSSTTDRDQEEMAEALTASKYVTVVVGQGPHVVQPIEKVNDKFVVYSEGNLISNEDINCCPAETQDGMIVLLSLVVDGAGAHVDAVRYVPVWVDHSDYSVLPVGDALAAGDGDPASLQASYERTTSVVGEGAGVTPDPPTL